MPWNCASWLKWTCLPLAALRGSQGFWQWYVWEHLPGRRRGWRNMQWENAAQIASIGGVRPPQEPVAECAPWWTFAWAVCGTISHGQNCAANRVFIPTVAVLSFRGFCICCGLVVRIDHKKFFLLLLVLTSYCRLLHGVLWFFALKSENVSCWMEE